MNPQRLLATGALAVLMFGQQSSQTPKSGIDLDGMDTTCKPCDDFYRYANGTFLDKNPIPARLANWGTFGMLAEANRERLRAILDDAVASKAPAGSSERQIGDFYSACTDTTEIDARGAKPIEGELKKIAAIRDRKDLARVLVDLQTARALGLYGLGSSPDAKKPVDIVLYVFSGGLSLPDRDFYFRDDAKSKETREAFVRHATRMFQLLGDDEAAASAAAKSVLVFETESAASRLTRVERRNPDLTYHNVGLAGIQKLNPSFAWEALLSHYKVPKGTTIIVREPKAIEQVEKQMAGSDLEAWKTWLRWEVVRNAATELSKPFRDEDFAFRQTVLLGVKEQRPRWQVCSSATDAMLGDALGQVFVKKHFPPEAKRRMSELVENLRETLRVELQNADWLQDATKRNALKKLDAFYPKIGYPDEFRKYDDVKISPKEYFANVRSAGVSEILFDLVKIGKPLDRNEWGMTPPTVNASFSFLRNEIAFPAGILQPPFFDLTADDAANYGAIGAVIGHEMGHGFDDQGSKYAADGSLSNWWTDEDRKKFDARAQCIIDEFNTLEVGDGLPKHDGKLVTGEALGDLGGVTIAFKAYQRSLNGKPAPMMDGFTGEQRFFLAFARVWARHHRDEDARMRLQTDPHPIARFRAIGTLQNVPEFHKAFRCKLGDFMVRPPEQQCKLW